MLPAWHGGQPAPPPILSPNKAGGMRNTQRACPSQASILEGAPPCDLIPAQAVGQEGSCNAHFPWAETGREGDTPQAQV